MGLAAPSMSFILGEHKITFEESCYHGSSVYSASYKLHTFRDDQNKRSGIGC